MPSRNYVSFSLSAMIGHSGVSSALSLRVPVPSSFATVRAGYPLSVAVGMVSLLSNMCLGTLRDGLGVVFSGLSLSVRGGARNGII